jgi:hypothetical protein
MSDGFYSDYTGAIFSGLGDTIKKAFLLFSISVFGHFVGFNCYEAPDLIARLWAGGLAGLSTFNFWSTSVDLALVPLFWVGTVFLSLTHLPTFLYPFLLLYAWLKIWLADEWWYCIAIILIAQPLDSWYLSCVEDHGMSRGAFALSGVFIGTYEIAAISAVIWYARQRESVE